MVGTGQRMTLILRAMKKHMGWEDAKDDYVILDGETSVGRIHKDTTSPRWIWSVNTSPYPAPPPNNGFGSNTGRSQAAIQSTIRRNEGSGSKTLRMTLPLRRVTASADGPGITNYSSPRLIATA
jgi:hypothetical protein